MFGKVTIGVVEADKLLVKHPMWKELTALQGQIEQLKAEMSRENIPDFIRNQLDGLEKEKMEAQTQLSKEVEEISRRIRDEQMRAEDQLIKEHEEISGKLEEIYKKAGSQIYEPDDLKMLSAGESDFNRQLQSFAQDIYYVKDRQLSARKLQLEKELNSIIEERKNLLDAELSQYEHEVMLQDQDKKLNLMLKIQVAKDDEEQQQIRQQLMDLEKADNEKKEGKRVEQEKKLQEFINSEKAKVDVELKKYDARLTADISRQINEKKNKMLKQLGKNPNEVMQKELDKRIEQNADLKAEKNKLEKEFEDKKAALASRLLKKQETAVAELKTRQLALETSLKDEETRILKLINDYQEKQQVQADKMLTERKKKVEELDEKARKMHLSMVDDLKKTVNEVAAKEHIDVVVTGFIYNKDCKDLTDDCLKWIEEHGFKK